jgi:hypothetical protein
VLTGRRAAAGRPILVPVGVALLCLFGGVLGACEDEKSPLSLLGGACDLNSDCDAGLVCLQAVCHEQCATSEDCGAGRCVVSADRLRVCQLDYESPCSFNSQCPPALVCSVDGKCRNQCNADRDCVPEQLCVKGVCAEGGELVDGRLPPSGEVNPIGSPCIYSSDCPAGEGGLALLCKSGVCAYACYEERDCGRFHRCTSPGPGEPGDCVLIGAPGALYCDPDEDGPNGRVCDCLGGLKGRQFCRSDGSSLDPCEC